MTTEIYYSVCKSWTVNIQEDPDPYTEELCEAMQVHIYPLRIPPQLQVEIVYYSAELIY